MSIQVFKRTREEVTPATVPATYTEWSDWNETTDTPPYTNTLLVEYKTRDEAEAIYKKMEELSKGTIENYVNSRSITPEQTTEIIASTINTMLVSAFDIQFRKEQNEKDLEVKTAQIAYTNAQKEALAQQLVDNRKIKVLSNISSTYGTMGAGGLTVSAEAWAFYFQIARNLIDGTSTISIPASTAITKVA